MQLTKISSVSLHTQSHRKVTMPVSLGNGTVSLKCSPLWQ